jgi:hypothetical protein
VRLHDRQRVQRGVRRMFAVMSWGLLWTYEERSTREIELERRAMREKLAVAGGRWKGEAVSGKRRKGRHR